MATKISIKKGGISLVTVLVGYVVAVAANAAAKVAGVELTQDQQAQATVAIVAVVSGALTGVLNWWKHRPKKEAPKAEPKVEEKAS